MRKSKKRISREWPLFTVGYENFDLRSFADCLKTHGIRNLVDVRQYPKSRKPGFSKSELERFFARNGVNYIHMGTLGCPSQIRKTIRRDKGYGRFFEAYLRYLVKQEESLNHLAEIIKDDTTCIFCLEADYQFCHRKSLASYLNVIFPESFSIIHL